MNDIKRTEKMSRPSWRIQERETWHSLDCRASNVKASFVHSISKPFHHHQLLSKASPKPSNYAWSSSNFERTQKKVFIRLVIDKSFARRDFHTSPSAILPKTNTTHPNPPKCSQQRAFFSHCEAFEIARESFALLIRSSLASSIKLCNRMAE